MPPMGLEGVTSDDQVIYEVQMDNGDQSKNNIFDLNYRSSGLISSNQDEPQMAVIHPEHDSTLETYRSASKDSKKASSSKPKNAKMHDPNRSASNTKSSTKRNSKKVSPRHAN